ncbi:hypothetical protein Rhe02_14580 [Rhizocola hellebori]|uniref:Uncharacterized protein n=1 Tax=Rhizocola hellebori TaxID=1392758 RepID=A0A8J3Q483_9ACTN|nr:hypothetical protein [Rhizocola hellebori]GIH03391.1 hypothetical protein Rhe02_14580 [Rhizocola hellebori]
MKSAVHDPQQVKNDPMTNTAASASAVRRWQPVLDKAPAAAVAVGQDSAGHPDWCAGGHVCTALTMPDGEHTSIPEVWRAEVGRVVATRHRRRDGRRNRMELRVVLTLDPAEPVAQAQCRHLIAVTHLMLRKVFGPPDAKTTLT